MATLSECYDKIRADLTKYLKEQFGDDQRIAFQMKILNITPIRRFSDEVQKKLKPHIKDSKVDICAIKKMLGIDIELSKEQVAKLSSFANLFVILSDDVLNIK